MMKQPLISIITSSYNAVQTIEQTINSVITQTYPNIEYIIIDGGSVDGTLNIIKKYDEKITYWVSETDKGIYNAWNKGLKIAKGSWIAFIGADDIYYPNAITEYVTYINSNAANAPLDFISSPMEYVDKNLKLIRIIGQKWNWAKFSDTMITMHCGTLHSRAFFEKYGNFDENYKITGDYALLLKAGKNLKAGFIDTITVKMRQGGISSDGGAIFNEVLKAKLDSGNVPLIKIYLRHYVGLVMYYLRRLKRTA